MSLNQPQSQEAGWSGNPWDQQPDEPDKWYGRFKVYLQLGPTRSVRATAHASGMQARNLPYGEGGPWSEISRKWHWRQRANAWDVHQRELLAVSERNTRLALRGRRIERMEDYLEAICEVLDTANITAVDEQQARAWLPQMRVFLRDLLIAERQEFERGDYEKRRPWQQPYHHGGRPAGGAASVGSAIPCAPVG